MNGYDRLRSILKSHKLNVTSCRLDVLELFLIEDVALTQRDLEKELIQYDRVTLYRTLKKFLASGIIHKIPHAGGAVSYGKCRDTCAPDHHYHDHVHFKCNKCGQIQCMDDQPVPRITLPDGYQVKSVNMIVDGLCDECN